MIDSYDMLESYIKTTNADENLNRNINVYYYDEEQQQLKSFAEALGYNIDILEIVKDHKEELIGYIKKNQLYYIKTLYKLDTLLYNNLVKQHNQKLLIYADAYDYIVTDTYNNTIIPVCKIDYQLFINSITTEMKLDNNTYYINQKRAHYLYEIEVEEEQDKSILYEFANNNLIYTIHTCPKLELNVSQNEENSIYNIRYDFVLNVDLSNRSFNIENSDTRNILADVVFSNYIKELKFDKIKIESNGTIIDFLDASNPNNLLKRLNNNNTYSAILLPYINTTYTNDIITSMYSLLKNEGVLNLPITSKYNITLNQSKYTQRKQVELKQYLRNYYNSSIYNKSLAFSKYYVYLQMPETLKTIIGHYTWHDIAYVKHAVRKLRMSRRYGALTPAFVDCKYENIFDIYNLNNNKTFYMFKETTATLELKDKLFKKLYLDTGVQMADKGNVGRNLKEVSSTLFTEQIEAISPTLSPEEIALLYNEYNVVINYSETNKYTDTYAVNVTQKAIKK